MNKILGLVAFAAILLPLQAVAVEPSVARSQFTSAILDREPVDDLQVIDDTTERVLFFTELLNMEGKTITHRWTQGGEVKAEVTFQVGGPRWRVYSSKQLQPEWAGSSWIVTVVDDTDMVYATNTLNYVTKSSEPATPAEPVTPAEPATPTEPAQPAQ